MCISSLFTTLRRCSWQLLLLTSLLLAGLNSAWAGEGEAIAYMGKVVQKVLTILRDVQLNTPEKMPVRREKLRAIVFEEFDFHAMSQAAVGPKWHKFSPAQKERFIQLFERLLENTYMNSIERYKSEEVRFTKELAQTSNLSRVDSVVVSKGTEFKVSYLLARQGASWKVNDVTIEGVSVVANYRAQFKQLLQRDDAEGIDTMLLALENSVQKSEK
ncbi:ABC transporter substrate-binding protein [Candidatus Magnetaquicoccus inordinatus]|uniref:Tgt2/MlaC family protein n=1 Tax=Candidatus Magnetaquicoccus inordinatus TaxID=2496818 RepID=UPI00102C1E29|nr:ABC transporter substrate-binding protein [Candidatus Magnetaquicoccus inordinatus]